MSQDYQEWFDNGYSKYGFLFNWLQIKRDAIDAVKIALLYPEEVKDSPELTMNHIGGNLAYETSCKIVEKILEMAEECKELFYQPDTILITNHTLRDEINRTAKRIGQEQLLDGMPVLFIETAKLDNKILQVRPKELSINVLTQYRDEGVEQDVKVARLTKERIFWCSGFAGIVSEK